MEKGSKTGFELIHRRDKGISKIHLQFIG